MSEIPEAVGKKVGPLPLGVWLMIGAVGIYFAVSRSRKTPQVSTADPSVPSYPDTGTGPGGWNVVPDSSLPTGTQGTGNGPTVTDTQLQNLYDQQNAFLSALTSSLAAQQATSTPDPASINPVPKPSPSPAPIVHTGGGGSTVAPKPLSLANGHPFDYAYAVGAGLVQKSGGGYVLTSKGAALAGKPGAAGHPFDTSYGQGIGLIKR